MDTRTISLKVDTGGLSEKIAISTTSAQSSAITTGDVVCTPDADCFVRQGTNPTAVGTGADVFLKGGFAYRLSGILPGNKLAFIALAGTGNVYLTPGA